MRSTAYYDEGGNGMKNARLYAEGDDVMVKAITIIRTAPSWMFGVKETFNVVKAGRRVLFTQENNLNTAKDVAWANAALGIKTAARAFQDAIDGKTVTLGPSKVRSGFGDSLALERTGTRIAFVAPCGATGYLTVREAEKLVALLREW